MDGEKNQKMERVLGLYTKLLSGALVIKEEEAQNYGVNTRSIQRDIDDIRSFLDMTGINTGQMNTVIYDRTRPEEVLERAKGAEMLITNKTVLDADIMDNLPSLRYIGVLATGYNVVDIQAAARHGITVTNIPAYGTDSVAQAVFAHIFNILYDISHYTEQNRRGVWQAKGDFCYWDTPLVELAGKRIGIVGMGNIGRAVVKLAKAFGMEIYICTSANINRLPADALSPDGYELPSMEMFNRVFDATDYIWMMWSGSHTIKVPWEGHSLIRRTQQRRSDVKVGSVQTTELISVAMSSPDYPEYEPVTWYGPGAQWNSDGIRHSNHYNNILFGVHSPEGSGWYINGGMANLYMTKNGAGNKDTRILRFMKSPVEYIY